MSPADQPAIDLHHVEKIYKGKVHALRGIEMKVRRGEIFGLLGPNGAGKSTLVKIMMSAVRPTNASGTILGKPIGHKPSLAHVGYLPEHHRLPQYLTGRQVLHHYAALARVPGRERRARSDELLATVGMTDWADKKISTYSKGMLQRVGLAQSMMNKPHLIVLDEPTDGVDPVGRREIRDVLVAIRDSGSTVFLNSHLLSELEMVCDRVAILVQGKVVQHGTIDDLTNESRRYEVVFDGDVPAWAGGMDGVRGEKLPGDVGCKLVMAGAEAPAVQPVIDKLRGEGRTIRSIRPVRESLEDLFMRAVADPGSGRPHRPGAVQVGARPEEKKA